MLGIRQLPLAFRCLAAALLTTAAWLLRIALAGWTPGFAYVAFIPVILLSTLAFGVIPGLVASGLGWFLAVWCFVEPVGAFRLDDWDDITYAILFPAVAAFAAVLVEVFRVMAGGGDRR